MRNIAFIVSLTTIFHAGHQGFVGTRAEQEDFVTEDFASTEENLYSDSTTPSNLVTEASTEVAIDFSIEDSINVNDEEETYEARTETIVLHRAMKKRSLDTAKDDVVHDEGKIESDGTFEQDPFPSNIELEASDNNVGASPTVVENLSTASSSEETVSQESEQVWRSGNPPHCIPLDKEERGLQTGLGWAAATAILIFAFSNTVIVGATLVISYILYQVVITALAVMAPGVAAVFVKFASLFHIF